MNSVNFKTEKNYINIFIKTFLFSFFYFLQIKVQAGWGIDLSRRQTDFTRIENQRRPASTNDPLEKKSASDSDLLEALKKVVNPVDPSLEIVILQTEHGFLPDKIQLKRNDTYKIHVVNLNTKEKNVSFMLDAFSQTHNTTYGSIKTFIIQPKIEGVYAFQSPETGAIGKVVILPEVKREVASQSSYGRTSASSQKNIQEPQKYQTQKEVVDSNIEPQNEIKPTDIKPLSVYP